MATSTADGYPSAAYRKETLDTLSFVAPNLRPGDAVLDIGCGAGCLLWAMSKSHPDSKLLAADIVDCRKMQLPHFELYDGIKLPFEDQSVDVVMLNFVLHHVPNETKPAVLDEIRRVCRRSLLVYEDTPRNFIDRYFNSRHGEEFRRRIKSTAGFGFYDQAGWERVFAERGFVVRESKRVGRMSRALSQPFARTFFALDVKR